MGGNGGGKRAAGGPSSESDFASDYSADARAAKAARVEDGVDTAQLCGEGGGDTLSSSVYGSDMVPLESSSHHASGHASAVISPPGSPRAESSSSGTEGADMMQQTATFVLSPSAVRAAETPRAQEAPAAPKFVFGSAAKTMVSFTALAGAKPADFSQGGAASHNDSEHSSESGSESDTSGGDNAAQVFGAVKNASEALPTVETHTGEEDEEVRFSARAKLFALASADGGAHEWRERGTGTVHLNESRATGCGRVVMRADGVLRVILNARLFEGMRYEPMQARSVRLSVLAEDGVVQHYLLRFRAPEDADAFVFELAVYCDGVPRDA